MSHADDPDGLPDSQRTRQLTALCQSVEGKRRGVIGERLVSLGERSAGATL